MGRILPVLFLDLTPFIGAGVVYLTFRYYRGKWRRAAERRAGPDNLNKKA